MSSKKKIMELARSRKEQGIDTFSITSQPPSAGGRALANSLKLVEDGELELVSKERYGVYAIIYTFKLAE